MLWVMGQVKGKQSESISLYFEKFSRMPFIAKFFSFWKQTGGIRTHIMWVEGEHADHKTISHMFIQNSI